MANPRLLAANTLLKIERDSAYSNITIAAVLKENDLNSADKGLFSALVYGVLDRKITLDFVLKRFIKTPLKKVAPFTLAILRSALYQIMFMDKIPESAAVNEAVKLIKRSKEGRNAGFVNGVLRSALREENIMPKGDTPEALSIIYSCPLWIVESFLEDYGLETAKELLKESLLPPPFTIRVNTVKTTAENLQKELEAEGVSVKKTESENTVILENGIDIAGNPLYKKGCFFAQDLACALSVEGLAPKKGERVLDMCAAPGGKSFTMAALMENEGEIISCDLYPQRVELIKKSAENLGLDIIKPTVQDACVFNHNLGEFDCVLCDVPCSGLGVLRRKPDIKYKPQEDFRSLEVIQRKILLNGLRYLKKGGRLLYSTCTLRRDENENLVISAVKEYNGLRKEYEHSFMPHIDKTDGFYCALLKRL